VSWGKVDPGALPDTVVCYLDVSVGLPLFAAYALARHAPRTPKQLYQRRGELMSRLESDYRRAPD
jgi:deoxyhypusine synthase